VDIYHAKPEVVSHFESRREAGEFSEGHRVYRSGAQTSKIKVMVVK
jgi:hypothetical protein